MDWSRCELVEAVPGKVSGVPVVRGSRVQADTISESYELGETAEQIAYSFDLNLEDVEAMLRFVHESQPEPAH